MVVSDDKSAACIDRVRCAVDWTNRNSSGKIGQVGRGVAKVRGRKPAHVASPYCGLSFHFGAIHMASGAIHSVWIVDDAGNYQGGKHGQDCRNG
jgi:hypothetical protein